MCVFIWSGSKFWVFHQQPDCRVVFCFTNNIIFSLRKQGKEFIIIKCKKLQGGKI